MGKLQEGLKIFGSGVLGIIAVIFSILFSLAFAYFGIKFTLSIGDRIFGDKKEESSNSQTTNYDITESTYVGTCQEEIIKQTGTEELSDVRNYCICIYDDMVEVAGGPNKLVEWQNSVSEDEIVSVTSRCQAEYDSRLQ